MKKLLMLVLLCATIGDARAQMMLPLVSDSPHTGVAKYTMVGTPAKHEEASSSSCATPAQTHTAGNLLVLLATSYGQVNTVSSVVGNADTYTAAASTFVTGGTFPHQTVIYYKLASAGAVNDVVTINWNLGLSGMSCTVVEYSYSGTALFDAGQNGTANPVNTVTSASFTAATSSNLNIAIGSQIGAGTNSYTAGSQYTLLSNSGSTANTEVEYRNPAPLGSQTASITILATTSDMQISSASFK